MSWARIYHEGLKVPKTVENWQNFHCSTGLYVQKLLAL